MAKKLIRITTVPLALRYLLPGQMKFMTEQGFDVLMISANGPEREKVIETEGCRHIIVPMTRKITPVRDLICLIKLIRIFRKEKPDLVHSHTPKAGLLGMWAARFTGVKVRIHTLAGIPFVTRKGFKYHLLKLIEKLTYSSATNVWPNSHSLAEYITQKKLIPRDKLKVISRGSSNGINLNRYNLNNLDAKILTDIKQKFDYDPKNFYLLFIGRIVRDKGIIELINAFINLHKKYNGFRLILAGRYERDLDPLPAHTVHEIENNPSIKHVNWTEMVEYYMSAGNCFIFPSHREGFPNVLLQAGALQLPVICSNIPGNVDLIISNETGLLFERENEKKLEEAIEYAYRNHEKMKEMAENLFKMIRENYKQEELWKAMLNEYRNLIQ